MIINHSTSIPRYVLPVNPELKNSNTNSQFKKEVEIIQDDSEIEKGKSNLWKELSKSYDVTNASFNELNEISTALYESGEISFDEHAILSFDFDRATQSLNQEMSTVDPSEKKNWIEEFQERAAQAFNQSNLIGHQAYLNLVGILQKLER